MPISSGCDDSMRNGPFASANEFEAQEEREWTVSEANSTDPQGPASTCPSAANALYSYPWLIERISQTFFREWIGAHSVPTKIDHADWLCTMCGDYTATWETRSGSYCRYCWSLGRTVSIKSAPTYMLEMIPLDGM